jgi:hypothetical protein
VQASASDARARPAAKLENAASPQKAAQLPATIETREPVQIGFRLSEAIAGAPGGHGGAPGARGDAARRAHAAPDVAEPNYRSMPIAPRLGEAVQVEVTTRAAIATPEAASTRATTRTAPPPPESNSSGASVVSHVAPDGTAVAIRVVGLSQRSADSLLDRVRELMRAHGVESCELFLNGERIDLAPPTSGSRSWR